MIPFSIFVSISPFLMPTINPKRYTIFLKNTTEMEMGIDFKPFIINTFLMRVMDVKIVKINILKLKK